MFKRSIFGVIVIIALLCNITSIGWCQTASVRTITDMAGRKVMIPVTVKKVFSTSQIGTITTYTINPQKLAGWNVTLSAEQKKFIPAVYHNIPVLGTWSEKNNTANIEEIIRIRPDFLLSMGVIDNSEISSSERIQKQ